MRAVVQRVRRASVRVEDALCGEIEHGLAVLVGVRTDDSLQDAEYVADKVVNLRVFEDEDGRMNRSVLDVGGGALIVSQFTLYGDARKGRRPSFTEAAAGDHARSIYQAVCDQIASAGVPVARGVFGAHMRVELENDGPVTILLDSRRTF